MSRKSSAGPRRRYVRPSAGSGRTSRQKRRYVLFTRWRRRRFFALLEESGNVRMAAELCGVGLGCVYRLRRVEAGFIERMAEAVGRASQRLAGDGPARQEAPPPRSARSPSPRNRGEDLGADPSLVIRRGRGGRLRVMAVGRRWWQARHDAVFLGHLAATGNVRASARAAGFTPKTAWNQRAARPAFAAAWEETLEHAEAHLEGKLIVYAEHGPAGFSEPAFEAAEEGLFDPWLALWLLKYWDAKRSGRPWRRR